MTCTNRKTTATTRLGSGRCSRHRPPAPLQKGALHYHAILHNTLNCYFIMTSYAMLVCYIIVLHYVILHYITC